MGAHQCIELGEAALATMSCGLAAQCIARGIDHDAVEPGGESALAAKGREPGGQGDAHVLRQVRRLLGVAEHADADPVDPIVVTLEQHGERFPVARGSPAGQRTVRVVTHAHTSSVATPATARVYPFDARRAGILGG